MEKAWISLARGNRKDILCGLGLDGDGNVKIMLGSGLSGRVLKEMPERRLLFEIRQKPDARETPTNLQG